MDNHGEEIPSNLDDVIGFIEQLLCDVDGDKWSNLESALGKIDFDNYIDDYENDDDDDDDLFHEEYHNEDCAMSLIYPILDIPSYFSRWISTIDINKAIKKKDFEKIIDKDSDMFLSFNYTKTLESLYGVLGVCHIHGVQDEKLLFGHGNDYDYFSDDNYGRQIGTESSFQEIHDKLKKDTKGAINDNISFFNDLGTSIDKIYSYGFSFSEVDEIYIREICKCLDTKSSIWYFNEFDDESIGKYIKILKKCGFVGDFNTYSINS